MCKRVKVVIREDDGTMTVLKRFYQRSWAELWIKGVQMEGRFRNCCLEVIEN